MIANEVFDRLAALVSSDNGPYEFVNVVRPTKLATYTPENGWIVLTRGDAVRVPDLDCPGNPPAMAWQQTFLIRVHIAPSEQDDTPVDVYEDIAEAEIQKAIRVDATWHTFGGNAINADFDVRQVASSDGGYDGIAIPLLVTYRIEEGDPYTTRL
jgi:hypothetical protein